MAGNPAVLLHNHTALNHEIFRGWMSPPDVRGTSDILFTCLVTMSLCVYTAIHPNIPRPSQRRLWLQRTLWVLTGLVAPEYVLWTALEQFQQARDLSRFLQKKWCEQERPMSEIKQFDLAYGFFVAMGGIRFPYFEKENEMGDCTDCLTAHGCKLLAEQGTFIQIDTQLISQQSRASAVAKLLVCCEVGWMSLQCVARKAAGLPLSLLEVHTFVHVVCATCIYGLWFKKPFDVPTAREFSLDGLDRGRICFLYHTRTGPYRSWGQILEIQQAFRLPPLLCACGRMKDSISPLQLADGLRKPWPREIRADKSDGVRRRWVCTEPPTCDQSSTKFLLRLWVNDGDGCPSPDCTGHPDDFKLTYNVPCGSLFGDSIHAAAQALSEDIPSSPYSTPPLCIAVSDWSNFTELDPFERSYHLALLLILVTATYGAVHLTAWNGVFPTKVEHLMWTSAAIFTASSVPISHALIRLGHFSYGHASYYVKKYRFGESYLSKVLNVVYYVAVRIFIGICILARMFLVLESFLQLRAVPIGVYAALPWTSYFPHF